MGTRALIARKTEDGWEAVYHHWDGYPEGLGATLYEIFNGCFEQDAKAMLQTLLDEHKAGWSTINGADWSLEPGLMDFRNRDPEAPQPPQCYCHGSRQEEAHSFITDKSESFAGAEYCYVISPVDSTMAVLERTYSDGTRAVQFFGVDASQVADGVNWKELAVVPLMGPEPDWASM